MTPPTSQSKTLSHDTEIPEHLLALLLACGAVRIASWDATIRQNGQMAYVGSSILAYVDLSGVFAPISAQRTIDHTELKSLWDCVRDPEYRNCGVYWWACLTLNQKPLKHIVADLKVKGVWNETLEQLPDNVFEAEIPKDIKLFH